MSDLAAKVSIIIDGEASAQQLEACLGLLADAGALEILVAADTPAKHPFTNYSSSPTLQLSDRWNAAAKLATGDFLLFIRSWIGLEASSVALLAEVLNRDMSIGACAPALVRPDGVAASQELIVIEDECKRRPIDVILRPVKFTYTPDWPSAPQDGIAYLPDILMVRKVAFWAAGGWEEGPENEELGLTMGFALKELNWRLVCERSVKAITAYPAPEALELNIRSRQKLVLRWYGRFLPHGHRTADGVIRHHPWIPANTGNLPTLCQGVASPFFPLTSGSAYRQGDIPGEQCSIIVVTYNSMTSIQACVTSVTENMGYFDELILVDNGSRDETPEFLKSLEVTDPRIKVILNGKNLGFAEGCNVGIAQSCGDYIVLLNPDTVATEGWLGRMRAYFLDSTVGAVGPISNGAFGLQGYNFHFPRNVKDSLAPADVHALATQVNARRAIESKLLIGFCLMVPRKILDKVGHLDPELFLGCDDLDLSWRLRLAGYRLLIASDVFVLHRVHVSFQTEPLDVIEPLERSSANAFAKKLQAHYGKGNVPSQEELWGIDWFRPPDVVVWPKAA